jgi:hypothetical protein
MDVPWLPWIRSWSLIRLSTVIPGKQLYVSISYVFVCVVLVFVVRLGVCWRVFCCVWMCARVYFRDPWLAFARSHSAPLAILFLFSADNLKLFRRTQRHSREGVRTSKQFIFSIKLMSEIPTLCFLSLCVFLFVCLFFTTACEVREMMRRCRSH